MEVRDNLKDERGWSLQTYHLKALLRCGKNWPDVGLPEMTIGNTVVYVKPRNPKGGRRQHRARCICSFCGSHMSAGRLHQHVKIHKV